MGRVSGVLEKRRGPQERLWKMEEQNISLLEKEQSVYGSEMDTAAIYADRLTARKRFYGKNRMEEGELVEPADAIQDYEVREESAEVTPKELKKQRKEEKGKISRVMKKHASFTRVLPGGSEMLDRALEPFVGQIEKKEELVAAKKKMADEITRVENRKQLGEEDKTLVDALLNFWKEFSFPDRMSDEKWFLAHFEEVHQTHQKISGFNTILMHRDVLWNMAQARMPGVPELEEFQKQLELFNQVYYAMREAFGIDSWGKEKLLSEQERKTKLSEARTAHEEYADTQAEKKRQLSARGKDLRKELRSELTGRAEIKDAVKESGLEGLGLELLEVEEIKEFAHFRKLANRLTGLSGGMRGEGYDNLIGRAYERMHYCSLKLGEIRLDQKMMEEGQERYWLKEDEKLAKQACELYMAEIHDIQEVLSFLSHETDKLSQSAEKWYHAEAQDDLKRMKMNTPIWRTLDKGLLQAEVVPEGSVFTIEDALKALRKLAAGGTVDGKSREEFLEEYRDKKKDGEFASVFDMFKELRGKDIMTLFREGIEGTVRQGKVDSLVSKDVVADLNVDGVENVEQAYQDRKEEATAKAKEGDREAGDLLNDMLAYEAALGEKKRGQIVFKCIGDFIMEQILDMRSVLEAVFKDVPEDFSENMIFCEELMMQAEELKPWLGIRRDAESVTEQRQFTAKEYQVLMFRNEEFESEEVRRGDGAVLIEKAKAERESKLAKVSGVEGLRVASPEVAELFKGISSQAYEEAEWEEILRMAERADKMMIRKSVFTDAKQSWEECRLKAEENPEVLKLQEKYDELEKRSRSIGNMPSKKAILSILQNKKDRTPAEDEKMARLAEEIEKGSEEYDWLEAERGRVSAERDRIYAETYDSNLPAFVRQAKNLDSLHNYVYSTADGAEEGIKRMFETLKAALAKGRQE